MNGILSHCSGFEYYIFYAVIVFSFIDLFHSELSIIIKFGLSTGQLTAKPRFNSDAELKSSDCV